MSRVSDENSIYPDKIARKYHFIDIFVRQHQANDPAIQSLYEKDPPKRKNSLSNLLSQNFNELSAAEKEAAAKIAKAAVPEKSEP